MIRSLMLGLFLTSPAFVLGETKRVRADLLIVGGNESGCAAAIQAARMGVKSIVLVNDIPWLGGQFSAQGLAAIDESADGTGVRHTLPIPRSGIFKEIMNRIEAKNLKKLGRKQPGNTRVITTCRPADAEQVFREMLAPYIKSGQIRLFENYHPIRAQTSEDGKRLKGVSFQSLKKGQHQLDVQAKLTIDASDWGDVVKLVADYEFGPDLKKKYSEPLAPTSRKGYPITDMNPITMTMTIVQTEKGQIIPKPKTYDARNYIKLPYPMTHEFFYTSRRVIDHYAYKEIKHPDVLLLCHPAQDYPLDVLPKRVVDALEKDEKGASKKNIVQMTRAQREIIFADARQHSLGLLYYLQTQLKKQPEDRHFARFKLTDEFGTPDRLPWAPYIRESLRMKSMYMMRQQDSTGHRGDKKNFAKVMYHDGVGCWQFEYDFHPTKRQFLIDQSGPWHARFRKNRTWGPPFSGRSLLAMRSLIPEKIDGLLGAAKNLGFSSLVSAAIRLHDHSTMVGQASGATAAVALKNDINPRAIPFDLKLLDEVRAGLCTSGKGIPQSLWPFKDLKPEDRCFVAVNRLAARQALPIDPTEVSFHPSKPATKEWRKALIARSLATVRLKKALAIPNKKMTRGELIVEWWTMIKDVPLKSAKRHSTTDADGDGVPDVNDPSPLDRNNDNLMDHIQP